MNSEGNEPVKVNQKGQSWWRHLEWLAGFLLALPGCAIHWVEDPEGRPIFSQVIVSTGHVDFEVPVRHLHGNVEYEVGTYKSRNLKSCLSWELMLKKIRTLNHL